MLKEAVYLAGKDESLRLVAVSLLGLAYVGQAEKVRAAPKRAKRAVSGDPDSDVSELNLAAAAAFAEAGQGRSDASQLRKVSPSLWVYSSFKFTRPF